MELTAEKSEQLAALLHAIKLPLGLVDVDYAQACVDEMYEAADFMDSTAALNRYYDPKKSKLIRKQADMLQKLIAFIIIGKDVTDLKNKVSETDTHYEKMASIFK